MTFEEYCTENNIDYNKIITLFNTTDDKIICKGYDKYITCSLHFKVNDEDRILEDDFYYLHIYIDNFHISIEHAITEHLYSIINNTVNHYTENKNFSVFKDALLAFKTDITDLKPYCSEYSNRKLEISNLEEYNTILELIDKLLLISNEDISSNKFKYCLDFIENDLTNILLKNDTHITNDKSTLLCSNNQYIKLIIYYDRKNYHAGEPFSDPNYGTDYSKLYLTCEIKEENITLDKTFSNLDELKKILQKIITLIEDNPNYTSLVRDLQDIL